MQKGFATLEIILVVLIISVLATAAVPNIVRILDRVALDYETKKIYTDLRFLQSFDRVAYMNDTHFNTAKDSRVALLVQPEKYIFRKVSANKDLDEHYFPNGLTASRNKDEKIWQIKFDDTGRAKSTDDESISDHLTLTSRFGKTYIVFNSVGRFRGSRTLPATEADY